ncbi:MAG: hypothetical protein WB757_15840 [Candidatus Cybelea sp.]
MQDDQLFAQMFVLFAGSPSPLYASLALMNEAPKKLTCPLAIRTSLIPFGH